jgi:membrane protease subunit HflK
VLKSLSNKTFLSKLKLILFNSPWGGNWENDNKSNQNPKKQNQSQNQSSNQGSGGSQNNPKKPENDDKNSKEEVSKTTNSKANSVEKDGFKSPFTGDSADSSKNSSEANKKSFHQGSKQNSDQNSNSFWQNYANNFSSANSSNSNKSKSSNNSKSNSFFTKISNQINSFFEGNNGGNSGNNQDSQNISKSTFGLFALAAILLWLSFGFFKVDTDENAVLLYFGKFSKIAQPGLNYHIPYPFGSVVKKSVSTVNTEEFGFSSLSRPKADQDFNAESLMLTGDENIVDVQFQVQWQIADIRQFVFNIAQPNESIRKSAESAMREVIARTPIAEALSDGKQKIELQSKVLLQEILDSYQSGVRVVLVQLRRVDPPKQVIDSFRDVQTAKADKEREINEAQAYANDIIPRARGAASQMKEESEAYASQVVTNSEGEAARFLAVYNQYAKAKQVTKRRIYLETMEQIYRDMDKIYIDKGASANFFSQLPLFGSSANQTNSSSINSSAPNVAQGLSPAQRQEKTQK